MSSNQSRAEQFYQQIIGNANPLAYLGGLVDHRKAEDEFLEFKGGGKIADKDAKQYWSQALSGFANTEGGVLIWGVRAARIQSPTDPSRTVDAASELDLVRNSATFLQMLKDVRLEATVNPVQGVEYMAYDGGEGTGAGFVVCLIREGHNKPYRAALDPAKQYYQRIGDSFAVIPHAMLRSLFFPDRSPALAVDAMVEHVEKTAKFSLSLINIGNATAKELYVVNSEGGITWAFGCWASTSGTPPDARLCLTSLHPGQSLPLGTIQVDRQPYFRKWNPVTLAFIAYMDDYSPQVIAIQYDEDGIESCKRRRFPATTEV